MAVNFDAMASASMAANRYEEEHNDEDGEHIVHDVDVGGGGGGINKEETPSASQGSASSCSGVESPEATQRPLHAAISFKGTTRREVSACIECYPYVCIVFFGVNGYGFVVSRRRCLDG